MFPLDENGEQDAYYIPTDFESLFEAKEYQSYLYTNMQINSVIESSEK